MFNDVFCVTAFFTSFFFLFGNRIEYICLFNCQVYVYDVVVTLELNGMAQKKNNTEKQKEKKGFRLLASVQ